MRRIDDNAQAIKVGVAWVSPLGKFNIACARVFNSRCPTYFIGTGHRNGIRAFHHAFDLELLFIGKLVAVGSENFDAVVIIRVVRSRDHDTEIGPHRTRQHGNGRRWNRTEQEHVHARRQKAGGQRLLDHVAGKARVLADHHAVPVAAAAVEIAGSHADFQNQIGGHGAAVGLAAHPVGSEIFPAHGLFPSAGCL